MTRRRRILAVAAAALAVAVAVDLLRPPPAQATTRVLVAAIGAYQATLSPLLPRLGVRCRFQPTCSHYAVASLRRHGALAGGARAAARIVRCGPWTAAGTVDLP